MPRSSITLLYPQVIVSRPLGECRPPTYFAGPKREMQNLKKKKRPKIVRHFNTVTAELSVKCQGPLKSYIPIKPTLEWKSDDGFRDSLFLPSPPFPTFMARMVVSFTTRLNKNLFPCISTLPFFFFFFWTTWPSDQEKSYWSSLIPRGLNKVYLWSDCDKKWFI